MALDCLARGGAANAFNLGNGSDFTIQQVLEAIKQVTGLSVPFEDAPCRGCDPAVLNANAAKAHDSLGDLSTTRWITTSMMRGDGNSNSRISLPEVANMTPSAYPLFLKRQLNTNAYFSPCHRLLYVATPKVGLQLEMIVQLLGVQVAIEERG